MPPACVQRKASDPEAEAPWPTMTEPSAETARAWLEKPSPGRSPRPTIPVVRVQRKASAPETELLWPTATEPSAETPKTRLLKLPPGRSPRPWNDEADATFPSAHTAQPKKKATGMIGM